MISRGKFHWFVHTTWFLHTTWAAETLAATIQQPMKECKAVLAELESRLRSMTFVRKYIVGKKWDKHFHRLVK
jgi:hypothetical protein